ncbi:MAG: glutaredoxin family protein [Pseudanabaenaceae cyanobacterium]
MTHQLSLIFYTKTDCCLCEALHEKLQQVADLGFSLETRNITQSPEWWDKYQYEVPVLYATVDDQPPVLVPRLSPRAKATQLRQMLSKYLDS